MCACVCAYASIPAWDHDIQPTNTPPQTQSHTPTHPQTQPQPPTHTHPPTHIHTPTFYLVAEGDERGAKVHQLLVLLMGFIHGGGGLCWGRSGQWRCECEGVAFTFPPVHPSTHPSIAPKSPHHPFPPPSTHYVVSRLTTTDRPTDTDGRTWDGRTANLSFLYLSPSSSTPQSFCSFDGGKVGRVCVFVGGWGGEWVSGHPSPSARLVKGRGAGR